MGAVEQAELHELVGSDVGNELGADVLPGGAAAGEAVLDHPLGEGFGEDGPGIVDADRVAEPGGVGRGGDGGDAVDHGAGEADFAFDPAGEGLILHGGEGEHGVAEDGAVVLDVVAGEQGGGGLPGVQAAAEGFDDDADRAGGGVGGGEVALDEGVVGVEALGSAVEAVAVFGDGEADDADRRVLGGAEQVGGGVAGEDGAGEGADHRAGFAGGVAFDQGVEGVLRGQGVVHPGIGGEKAGAEDAPLGGGAVGLHEVVGVAGHVGAVEVAKAEMDDAGADGGRVVGWGGGAVGQGGEVGAGEGDGRHGWEWVRIFGGRQLGKAAVTRFRRGTDRAQGAQALGGVVQEGADAGGHVAATGGDELDRDRRGFVVG